MHGIKTVVHIKRKNYTVQNKHERNVRRRTIGKMHVHIRNEGTFSVAGENIFRVMANTLQSKTPRILFSKSFHRYKENYHTTTIHFHYNLTVHLFYYHVKWKQNRGQSRCRFSNRLQEQMDGIYIRCAKRIHSEGDGSDVIYTYDVRTIH